MIQLVEIHNMFMDIHGIIRMSFQFVQIKFAATSIKSEPAKAVSLRKALVFKKVKGVKSESYLKKNSKV